MLDRKRVSFLSTLPIKITTPRGVVIFMDTRGNDMLERNEFALRRGFACGKTLTLPASGPEGAGLKGLPQILTAGAGL